MTNKELAEQHISDALSKGYIVVDGVERPVQVSTIIQLSRAILKDEISKGEAKELESAIPSDMFDRDSLSIEDIKRATEQLREWNILKGREEINADELFSWNRDNQDDLPLTNLNNS